MKSWLVKALAASVSILCLISCGGSDEPAATSQTVANSMRQINAVPSAAPVLSVQPTVTIRNWQAHNEGLCGAVHVWDPFTPYSFDVSASSSEDLINVFVAKMQSICDGQMADAPYTVATTIGFVSDLVWGAYVNGAQTWTAGEITWRETIIQSVPAAPYGTISCPLGFKPDWPEVFDAINSGQYPLSWWAGSIHCLLPPVSYLSPKSLGKPEHCPPLNPINQATGNKLQVETDLRSSTEPGLSLVRTYNSDPAARLGMFGAHWSTAFDRALVRQANQQGYVEAVRPDGKRIGFADKQNTSGQWETLPDIRDTLQQTKNTNGSPTGWRYVSVPNDEVEVYDVAGHLLSVTNRAGQTITHAYSAGRLDQVTDPYGRTLAFVYDGSGRVSSVTDSMRRVYRFGYDGANNLVSVTYPDAKVRRYLYNEPAFMGGSSLSNALTGIVDEAGERFATYTYNGLGLAVGSEHADGAGRGTIAYEFDNAGGIVKSTVKVGTAEPTVYDIAIRNGVAQVTNATAPCWAGGTAMQQVDRPYQGTVGNRTDFNGIRTVVSFDVRKNEVSRSEAAGTPLQRDIRTDWHPQFRLPIKVTEPGRVSEFGYDAAGNRTIETVRDAATGASRTWAYTYNARGQVTSIDGPRTDVSDVTTLTYDANGNLATSTNALGQTTRFTAYDALGHLLEMTDANGLTSRFVYDARDRLTRASTGSENTDYTYTATGELATVSLPSGAGYRFDHDRAHRLTSITDAEGAKIV